MDEEKIQEVRDMIETYKNSDMEKEVTIKSVGHSEDCDALEEVEKGNWDSPWTVADNEVYLSPEDGTYIGFVCNTIECDGFIVIKESKLLELLPHKIGEVKD